MRFLPVLLGVQRVLTAWSLPRIMNTRPEDTAMFCCKVHGQ
jgi:hypothetical protein